MSEVFDRVSHVFTQVDIADFKRIEVEIEKDQAAFLRVGSLLVEVRDRKLYGIVADTFEDYVRDRWGWSKQRAYQLIAAKSLVEDLPEKGKQIVDSEGKARALSAVPPRRRMRVIRDAVASAPNGKPTARHIEEAAQRDTSPPPKKPEQKDILLDATGWPVPDNLVPLFERFTEVKQHLNSIAAIRGMLRRVQENKDQLWSIVNFSATMIDLDRAFQEIKQAVPYAVCPYCSGHDDTRSHCTNCHQRGAVSELFWKQAIPEEIKAVRAKSSKR